MYHVYLKLHGPKNVYERLYEYLNGVGAQKVGPDYPELWYFMGWLDEWEKYQEEIFRAINSNVPENILDHPEIVWRVFIIGPTGHNSCAGGLPLTQP
jgi:hypothetical protein